MNIDDDERPKVPRQGLKRKCGLKALQANRTLEAVGDLLITGCDTGSKRNQQIHAVVTFSADNLLELYCAAKTKSRPVVTMVDRASVGDHPDQISIYHLHGTLDARGKNVLRAVSDRGAMDKRLELPEELLPDLVFRESEYYETIGNPLEVIS